MQAQQVPHSLELPAIGAEDEVNLLESLLQHPAVQWDFKRLSSREVLRQVTNDFRGHEVRLLCWGWNPGGWCTLGMQGVTTPQSCGTNTSRGSAPGETPSCAEQSCIALPPATRE